MDHVYSPVAVATQPCRTYQYTTFRYPSGQRDIHASGAEWTLLQADGLAAKRLYRGFPGATLPNHAPSKPGGGKP